jgi:hypothetical protein
VVVVIVGVALAQQHLHSTHGVGPSHCGLNQSQVAWPRVGGRLQHEPPCSSAQQALLERKAHNFMVCVLFLHVTPAGTLFAGKFQSTGKGTFSISWIELGSGQCSRQRVLYATCPALPLLLHHINQV